jgi:hypothetical protein
MTNKIVSLFLLIFVASLTSYGQSFLNGDFEINSALTDQINLINSQYDSLMTNSTAFGNYNGGGANGGNMDIITSSSYCGSSAQQGNWYVCLTGGGTDAISLKLSTPLIAGHSYTISFYDRFGQPPATVVHPFQIGLSLVDTTFGSLLYTAPNANNCLWSLRSFSFIAPTNGQFVTAKISAGGTNDTWCHLDNFTIEEATSIQTVNQNNYFQIFPNPTSSEINIKQLGNYYQLELVRVLNQFGQEVFKSNFVEKIDVSDFANGLYIFEIRTDNKTHYTKFLKQ